MNARSIRSLIRSIAGASKNTPIKTIEDSDAAPRLVGEPWHYVTRGGRYICHPSAYSRRGWGNMVYVHSTLRVEVGTGWQPQTV